MIGNATNAICLLLLLSLSATTETLGAGTTLEARFSVATGSHVSRKGDKIAAMVIAPVTLGETIVIPAGAYVRGNVVTVVKLGFGLKQRTARINYRFSNLELPHGEILPLEAQLLKVEMAKESVDSNGTVLGVHPLANLSSASNYYIQPLLFLNPVLGVPIWAVKAVIAPSSSPEIYFPVGTECLIRLNTPLVVSHLLRHSQPAKPLSPDDTANMRDRLQNASSFRAFAGSSPSDLINLVFIGTRRQIAAGFEAAGWSVAERKSPVALYKMYRAITRRIGYRNAPMNKLSLNGKYSDFTYQKGLNTIAKRHHVRFWKDSPKGDVWLGAASEDVALHFRAMHWTHLVDPAIDHERAKIVNDLAFTGCLDTAGVIERQSTPDSTGGAPIKTDRKVAAVRFNDCEQPKDMPGIHAHQSSFTRRWFPQVMRSFRDDLMTSNPTFTAFNTLRALTSRQSLIAPQREVPDGSLRPGLDWMKPLPSVAFKNEIIHSR